jgi:hypothetical protein
VMDPNPTAPIAYFDATLREIDAFSAHWES